MGSPRMKTNLTNTQLMNLAAGHDPHKTESKPDNEKNNENTKHKHNNNDNGIDGEDVVNALLEAGVIAAVAVASIFIP